MLATIHDIETFIRDFEAGTLPRVRWTHHAHLVVAAWYLTHHTYDDALDMVRRRIRAYNDAIGTPNTDSGGYHETLTRFFLRGVAGHIARHPNETLPVTIAVLIRSTLGSNDWPLRFYSRERLFSAAARHHWVEADLAAIEGRD